MRFRCARKAQQAAAIAIRDTLLSESHATAPSSLSSTPEHAKRAAEEATAAVLPLGPGKGVQAALYLASALQSAADPESGLSSVEGYIGVQRALAALAPSHASNAGLFADLRAAVSVLRGMGGGDLRV